MASRKIVQAPQSVLRQKAKRVRAIDGSIRDLVQDLIDSMPPHGVGLAAPQIGVPLRVAIVRLPDDDEPTVLINPKVVRREGEREIEEACLSLEGYQGLVTRSEKVRVRATRLDGKTVRLKAADDLRAQALEHEIDHLDGVLFVDNLVSEDKLVRLDDEDLTEPAIQQSPSPDN